MKKFILIFLFFGALVLVGCARNKNTPTVKINNHIFKVEVAKTVKEKYQGLSNRENLKKDQNKKAGQNETNS